MNPLHILFPLAILLFASTSDACSGCRRLQLKGSTPDIAAAASSQEEPDDKIATASVSRSMREEPPGQPGEPRPGDGAFSALEDACKSFAASHARIGYNYCLNFFKADGASATADKRGLAAIAVDLTGEAAISTARRVAELQQAAHANDKDGRLARGLGDCADLYSSALRLISGKAAHGIAGGLENAVVALSVAWDAPETCEQWFRDLNVSSPLAAEDDAFSKEVTIALSVTSALLKS